ncbi:hypothetical protein J3R30DRAFT_27632 [Lentinula aciculospora]|uniref:Uncharacterized protein n=1 Tax=Lentinula aciculospora TaxID=153920 RepID=A0A9W9ATB6_9AGAR|nr:hypothetical protein J3R30DRAFT_27632 [Lentinula aciculospora]
MRFRPLSWSLNFHGRFIFIILEVASIACNVVAIPVPRSPASVEAEVSYLGLRTYLPSYVASQEWLWYSPLREDIRKCINIAIKDNEVVKKTFGAGAEAFKITYPSDLLPIFSENYRVEFAVQWTEDRVLKDVAGCEKGWLVYLPHTDLPGQPPNKQLNPAAKSFDPLVVDSAWQNDDSPTCSPLLKVFWNIDDIPKKKV